MVLKDFFINEDHPREGEMMTKIVESFPIGDKRHLHFLTVVVIDPMPYTLSIKLALHQRRRSTCC